MATYKQIRGVNIQSRDSDPTAVEGDVWYNASTSKIKMFAATGSWASGGDLNAARMFGVSVGTQTAGLVASGEAATIITNSEEYNGSTWTEGTDINTAGNYNYNSFGTQTAACAAGRNHPSDPPGGAECEEYNGTSWTEVTNTDTTRYQSGGAGTQTAGLVWGGKSSGGNALAIVETYDGTNWAEVGDLNTGRENVSGCGAQTAALCIGGYPAKANVESYNGTSWTEIGDLNANTYGAGSFGTSTSAIIMGNTPTSAKTEQFDGTSWSEVNDLSVSRAQSNGAGHQTSEAGFVAGGGPPAIATTEEWTVAASVQTVAFD
tara:strand:+ start:105 stop:1061 length:957 start_codon:yes stop_codon:yes gene_type:complete